MCFRFGSCFGSHSGQGYGRSTPKGHTAEGGRPTMATTAAPTGPQVYDGQPALARETGRNAYNGAMRKDHVDDGRGHGGYAAYVQDKADETLKLPAWHNKVGDDAGHTYTACLPNSSADYHYYPTMATTAIGRY